MINLTGAQMVLSLEGYTGDEPLGLLLGGVTEPLTQLATHIWQGETAGSGGFRVTVSKDGSQWLVEIEDLITGIVYDGTEPGSWFDEGEFPSTTFDGRYSSEPSTISFFGEWLYPAPPTPSKKEVPCPLKLSNMPRGQQELLAYARSLVASGVSEIDSLVDAYKAALDAAKNPSTRSPVTIQALKDAEANLRRGIRAAVAKTKCIRATGDRRPTSVERRSSTPRICKIELKTPFLITFKFCKPKSDVWWSISIEVQIRYEFNDDTSVTISQFYTAGPGQIGVREYDTPERKVKRIIIRCRYHYSWNGQQFTSPWSPDTVMFV